ncbi:MAG: tryptophan synthase subunit alpha [Pseudomonadota bacterium]
MSRINACFAELKRNQKKALIPYIVCGDPSLDVTVDLMHALVEAGSDILELGVPFSDPMAEGPTIQLAHERALEHNTNLIDIFNCVREFRKNDASTPIVLMGYANPIEKMGYDNFSDHASDAGVDGVLVVDLPYEEVGEFNQSLKRYELDNIFLLTPTTDNERAQKTCAYASGYLYYVSLKGVTGSSKLDVSSVQENYARISAFTELPICVGFGISDAVSARQVADIAEGVVIGSALINVMIDFQAKGSSFVDDTKQWMNNIRVAIDA